jgi:hypothetical protein
MIVTRTGRGRDGMSRGNGLVGQTTASGLGLQRRQAPATPKVCCRSLRDITMRQVVRAKPSKKAALELELVWTHVVVFARGKTVVLILAMGVYPRHHGGLFGIVFHYGFFGRDVRTVA